MEKDSELFKIEDRHCPICGKFIKADSLPHHCLKKDLKKIDKARKIEVEETEEDRTYDDKLNEFDQFYNSETYYEKDEEE